MLPLERKKWIEQELIIHKRIDIEEISKKLNVSTMTIRRDLKQLENNKKAIRTHGGAVSVDSITDEIPYFSKKVKNNAEKIAIAKNALSFISDNSTIILDSGTTTFELAKLMKERSDLTIVTNDIKIANELLDSPNKVIVTGGELQQEVGALYGTSTQNMLKVIHADLFFLGAHAIDIQRGITSPTFEKSLIKQLMLKAADKTWVLADYSKFNQKVFTHVCDLSEIEGIITDSSVDSSIVKNYEEQTQMISGEREGL